MGLCIHTSVFPTIGSLSNHVRARIALLPVGNFAGSSICMVSGTL